AMVNQTASAIRSLTQNSRTLSDGVRVFCIDGLGAEPALQHDPEPRVANAGW
ncbi:MAG: chemotaxis protein, partial [Pelagibaca sp.]|nr:chemotaxis protein [Pelagibaca sp.]